MKHRTDFEPARTYVALLRRYVAIHHTASQWKVVLANFSAREEAVLEGQEEAVLVVSVVAGSPAAERMKWERIAVPAFWLGDHYPSYSEIAG